MNCTVEAIPTLIVGITIEWMKVASLRLGSPWLTLNTVCTVSGFAASIGNSRAVIASVDGLPN